MNRSSARWAGRMALCVILATGAHAAAAEPLALRRIMKDLGGHMRDVAGAIAHEDWSRIRAIAPLIGDHPQPPALEKARILAYVGANAGAFRAHDQGVHAAARALGEAAERRDAEAVIASYAALQRRCHGCHAEFRERFVDHFHGGR